MAAVAPSVERTQDVVIRRKVKRRRDWAKWGLATYFVIFLIFLYAPMILMAILSFQGYYGGVTFPFRGPASIFWWRSIFESQIGGTFTHAPDIAAAGHRSLWLSLVAGLVVAFFSFTLSMAFRRRFRGDGIAFYVIMLALMTPGFLLGLGTQLLWKAMGVHTDMWQTALGRTEEAARDLGANLATTFREVTLPLVWTGIFGAALFGFTLTWNDFDRTVLLVLNNTLPLEIVGLIQASAIRPDLYALGTATTLVTLALIFGALIIVTLHLRLRGRRVERVEEELGLEGAIDAEAAAAASGE